MRNIQATKYLWITLLSFGVLFVLKAPVAHADIMLVQSGSNIQIQPQGSDRICGYMNGTLLLGTDSPRFLGEGQLATTGGGNFLFTVNTGGATLVDASFEFWVVPTGSWIGTCVGQTGFSQYIRFQWLSGSMVNLEYSSIPFPPDDVSTRFISIAPTASSTIATSSATTVGAHVFINPNQYVDGHTFLRMSFTNYTASLVTGSALQAWDSAFGNILLPITASSTDIDVSTSTTKFEIYQGKTEGAYQVVTEDCSWYSFIFGCSYNPVVASSTYFYIGGKTGFDISQEAGNLGIFGLAPGSDPFVATTTNAAIDCNLAISFDLNKCLWSFVIPNQYLANQVLTNFKSLPILGWPIRFVEIVITTTATSSLPVINYTFAAHNSFVGGVNIHFNPWQYMFTSGSLVKDQWVADDGSGNIWDIMGPFVKLVVYLTLGFVIIRRLTGLNWGGEYTTTETGSETISSSEKLPDGARKTFSHSITKRRKL